jgi:type II secretory pathway pseudopilin PulG
MNVPQDMNPFLAAILAQRQQQAAQEQAQQQQQAEQEQMQANQLAQIRAGLGPIPSQGGLPYGATRSPGDAGKSFWDSYNTAALKRTGAGGGENLGTMFGSGGSVVTY